MWDRTLTVCSAGKIFSVTGWKLGWTIGPNSLQRLLQAVHQNCIYTAATPLQVLNSYFIVWRFLYFGGLNKYYTYN
jgi:aspartate/methionine/tyrosine aminotransferase